MLDALRRAAGANTIGIAWSGGADSTALLHGAVQSLGTDRVVALHVDHGLRPGSEADARWCAATADAIGVSFRQVRLRLDKSTETSARYARYCALGDLCVAAGATQLFTAHHAQDNLESLLIALIRGAGVTGLGGIRPAIALAEITHRPAHAGIALQRPWLDLDPSALRLLLAERPFREDPTNALLDRTRNVLRHRIIPDLMGLADDPGPMLRTPATVRRDRELLEALAVEALEAAREGDAYRLRALPDPRSGLGAHWIRALLRPWTGHPPDRATVQRVGDFLAGPRGGRVQVRGAEIHLNRGQIRVARPTPETAPADARLAPGESLRWGSWLVACDQAPALPAAGVEGEEYFDAAAVELPLRIRKPRAGERMTRFAGGTKRLRRILADRGMPSPLRALVPVIEDAAGKVLVVGGAGRTDHAPVGSATVSCLRIACYVTRAGADCGGPQGSL